MEDFKNLQETQLSSQPIFDGDVLHIFKDTIRLPNGKQATREYTVHHGAVCILPLLENGDVLLEHQFRYPMGEVITEIPAGKLDYIGEDPQEAALRELREETGIEADEADFHLVRSFREHSTFSDVYFLFHDIPLSALHLQPGETTEARWVSKAGLEALVASGEVAQPDVRRLRQLRDEFRKIWNA